MTRAIVCVSMMIWIHLVAQEYQSAARIRDIEFGNIPGYRTMKCDFHQHTVFSDGSVWPNIRVYEAVLDGLDAIAITDHLEYQPHRSDIPNPDRNQVYRLASEYAKNHDIIIINGCEITRDLPPGHANAIFINDANQLLLDDPLAVFREAKKQNAFVFWNHPHWTSQKKDGLAELTSMHRMLIQEGLIQGIEIVNEHSFSEEALQIALDNNLTIIGCSDIHGLIDWEFNLVEGGHRPLTLVFATEKSIEAIKEGLTSGRTVVWFDHSLIGKSEYIVPLIDNAFYLQKAKYIEKTIVAKVYLENKSDVEYLLKNKSDFSFHRRSDIVHIKPRGTTVLEVKTRDKLQEFGLRFEVLNALIAPQTHPEIYLTITVDNQ